MAVTAGAARQFRTVAWMRSRMLANSLRTKRGRIELSARLFWTCFYLLIWLMAAAGMGFASWQFTVSGHPAMISLLLWPVLAMWQLLPVMLASFQENVDLAVLLRFPISFPRYVLLYVFFGFFDLTTLLGGVALLGICVGVSRARPDLAFAAAAALALFGLFNLLLTRAIFAWLDRILAQRRTREIVGLLVLFCFLGLQWLNPAFHHGQNVIATTSAGRAARSIAASWPLPPALAGRAVQFATHRDAAGSAAALGLLALFAAAAGLLLAVRLRSEYRGESFGEGPRRLSPIHASQWPARPGWTWISGPVAAVFEKELRYLRRSGAMLYSLAAPLFLLFLFGGMSSPAHAFTAAYALPLGAAYGFLGLTRLVGNSFGGDSAGIQFYFLSPASFRSIMLAKNIFHTCLFCFELLLVCCIVWLRYGRPGNVLIAATFCWLLFAVPAQLAFGNVLSIKMAYRMTLTRMSREPGAIGNGSLSLLLQIAALGIGAAVFLPLARSGHPMLAIPAFLLLAGIAMVGWWQVLARVDGMANRRREQLTAVLVRGT